MSQTMALFVRLQEVLAALSDAIEEEAPDGGAELLAEDLQAIGRRLLILLSAAEEEGVLA